MKLDAADGTSPTMTQEPDPQVVPKAERRRFSAEYKQRILAEADRCTKQGEIGALLRREGLYSSHLTTWRRQRDQGTLGQKRGRKPDAQAAEVKRLQRENEQLRTRLERVEHIIDVQKKICPATWNEAKRDVERREFMMTACLELASITGVAEACRILEIPRSTLYRLRKPTNWTTVH